MPAGQDVFNARLRRIAKGQQIVGQGLGPNRAFRPARRRSRGPGKALMAAVLVLGGITGAVAAGHGPEGLDTKLFAWGAQLQGDIIGFLEPAAAQAAGFGADILPRG